MSNANVMTAGVYPERQEPRMEWLDQMVASAEGMILPWLRPRPERFNWIVDRVNEQGRLIEGLSDGKILHMSRGLRPRLRRRVTEKTWWLSLLPLFVKWPAGRSACVTSMCS